MRRKQSESKSTRETEKAREDDDDEEGSGKQRDVLLCPATREGTVTVKPNRKHRQMETRMDNGDGK